MATKKINAEIQREINFNRKKIKRLEWILGSYILGTGITLCYFLFAG